MIMKNLYILLICILFLFTVHQAHSLNLPSASKGFEQNYGQVASIEGERINNILFSTKERGFSLYFKSEGVSYVIYQHESKGPSSSMNHLMPEGKRPEDTRVLYARIDLDLVNSRIERSNIIYEEALPGYSNYYLAHCPEGILNVRSYNKVRIKGVYHGIDWVFRYDERGELHHEFEVSPGADVNQIKFSVKWADARISPERKEMVLSTPLGEIKDGKIISHEGINEIDARYRLAEDGIIGYEVINWSGREKLMIDPPLALLWATLYGGNNYDYGTSITTDGSGNVLMAGWVRSSNFPLQNPGGVAYFQGTYSGNDDAFILKFANSGIRQWATYYGGSGGDYGSSLAITGSGNVFVTGHTFSTDFPLLNPGEGAYYQGTNGGGGNSDAFILMFTNTGVRQWATYYGGNGSDIGYSLAKDGSGNIFVTGDTRSTNFPVQNPEGGAYFQGTNGGGGNSDVFILKFTNTAVRQWATYYGGSSADVGYSLATDVSGNVFVTGQTLSTNFPLQNPGGGAYYQGTYIGNDDAFILKFTNTGVIQWATYYGGNYSDHGYSLATDGSGNVFITGVTSSTNFPLLNPGGGAYYQGHAGIYDAFIMKFTNAGVRQWATYYGGSAADERGYSLAIDGLGNVFVTGETRSTNFPLLNPGGGAYYQVLYGGGNHDAFMLKFTNEGVRKWATYYGGDERDNGYSLAIDGFGNVFVTGWAYSSIPLQNPGGGAYFQGTFGGGDIDAFILKFESSLTEIQPIGNFVPSEFVLKQNYPNPFNPATQIDFDIPSHTRVKLTVYDITGREVSRIVDGELSPGSYSVGFDAGALSSGLYLYRLEAGDYVETNRMMLVK
jgi:hypothetical protein